MSAARSLRLSGKEVALCPESAKCPFTVPAGVEVSIEDGNVVTVKGPEGYADQHIPSRYDHQAGGRRRHRHPARMTSIVHKSLHGLTRTLLQQHDRRRREGLHARSWRSMGVGYQCREEGQAAGYEPGLSPIPSLWTRSTASPLRCPQPTRLSSAASTSRSSGQFAAEVRGKRPPEPYKGKGIKYSTEVIRLKEGKTGGKK